MHRRTSIRFLLVALLALTGLTTPYAQNATPASVVPRIDVEKYTLPNGLEVILSRKPGIPMVSVNLWYHVGPANELPGRTGFAHLFEHMMFQASKHVPEDTHFKFL
jgi:predicted Zn-dependent peptidase